ncbi:monooxygenase, FAD-binding protein [alpha proteobacterium BAL199]|jgi:2-polyprenyl-6-methoxyphenol hydroxylase-like FAD-dependent oxidoreductase|nr:monooxygenase, FAD-binding protein [alpha proteobacterium BAL199]
MDIAIAGAGIGGPAAGAMLAQAGHDVTIYDQFAAPAPVGSGLVIQPVGPNDTPGLAIHRSALFATLHGVAVAAGVKVVPGHKVIGAQAGRLHFEGGGVADPADLVIDASGARSTISPLRARDLPHAAIWGTVDWPDGCGLPVDELTQRYRRADRMIGVLPIGTLPGETTGKAAIFWSLPRDGHEVWVRCGLDGWRDEVRALWPEFAPFAEQITEPAQMAMAHYSRGTLRRPWGEKLAIIGDAAHRASPQLGQSANMALLDAAALAAALEHTDGAAALRLYAAARRWHVRVYQAMSWAFTPQYQSDSRILPVLRTGCFIRSVACRRCRRC